MRAGILARVFYKSLLNLYATLGWIGNSLIFNDIQKKGERCRKVLPYPRKVHIILVL